MSSVGIRPGITVDCRGLTKGEKESVAVLLDKVATSIGGRSYTLPPTDYLIIDGECDSNSVSAPCDNPNETVQEFTENYRGYFGAEPYIVDARELLYSEE